MGRQNPSASICVKCIPSQRVVGAPWKTRSLEPWATQPMGPWARPGRRLDLPTCPSSDSRAGFALARAPASNVRLKLERSVLSNCPSGCGDIQCTFSCLTAAQNATFQRKTAWLSSRCQKSESTWVHIFHCSRWKTSEIFLNITRSTLTLCGEKCCKTSGHSRLRRQRRGGDVCTWESDKGHDGRYFTGNSCYVVTITSSRTECLEAATQASQTPTSADPSTGPQVSLKRFLSAPNSSSLLLLPHWNPFVAYHQWRRPRSH